MPNNNLIHIFNNQYERNGRHKDTYYTDKPGLSKEDIEKLNIRNFEVLKLDTLKQILSMSEYFNTNNILYYLDYVYQDLLEYKKYNNIEDFIEDKFIKKIVDLDEI